MLETLNDKLILTVEGRVLSASGAKEIMINLSPIEIHELERAKFVMNELDEKYNLLVEVY
ncbi:MAG TPA: hypothetical protein VHG29_01890 [Novosphingobium sp.]|nr:hypothetical protein [Novosphingobium sp.]